MSLLVLLAATSAYTHRLRAQTQATSIDFDATTRVFRMDAARVSYRSGSERGRRIADSRPGQASAEERSFLRSEADAWSVRI